LSSVAPPLVSEAILTSGIPQERAIGALWRRIVAFLLDDILVGIAGILMTLPFFETLSRLGAWGRLLGFCLALPYFAILNSKIGNGQTLGKRWMRIQVIDESGRTLNFSRSAVRYVVLAIPYFLNGLVLPVTRTHWAIASVISLIVFGVGGATLYLVLFNRHTRQGVHDLAVGSYVVNANNNGAIRVQSIWKPHWAILTALLIALLGGGGILGNKLTRWGPFPELLEDARLVETVDGVQSAAVQDLRSSNWGSSESKKTLVVSVRWTGKAASETAFADDIARLLMRQDPKVQDHDSLRIVLIRGYDIGIAHAQAAHPFEHTPAAWNARLFGTPPMMANPAKL
jgi:uncharacterized RDD family membrane protein YckC